MASELIVQTLKGPTSGANANKVIIPSGQTLDASAGGLVPASGQVVQCVQFYNPNPGDVTSTSASLVASGLKKTITPTYSDSLIIIQAHTSMSDHNNAGYLVISVFVNGSAMPGTGTYPMGYQDSGNGRYAGHIFQGQYQATSTSPLEFELYFRCDGGGQPTRVAHDGSTVAITLWEIKQ